MNDILRAEGFDMLAVGGHPHLLPTVTESLIQRLRDRVAGTFTIDAVTATPADADVRACVEDVVTRYEQNEQRGLLAEIAEAGCGAAPGGPDLESCLWAGVVSAIDRLTVRRTPRCRA